MFRIFLSFLGDERGRTKFGPRESKSFSSLVNEGFEAVLYECEQLRDFLLKVLKEGFFGRDGIEDENIFLCVSFSGKFSEILELC